MIDCKTAESLFDPYLDGELSPSMMAELNAHRVSCADCRRALALLEVAGHVLTSDSPADELPPEFADRLLACVKSPRAIWLERLRRGVFVGGPMAAAAVVALAFLGFFDRTVSGPVAGEVHEAPPAVVEQFRAERDAVVADEPVLTSPEEEAMRVWFERVGKELDARRAAGESPSSVLDLTILQLLDILESAPKGPEVPPARGSGDALPAAEPAADGKVQVEDL